MKKLKLFILLIIMTIPSMVYAASASMTVPWSGETGGTVTANITLYNVASWNIKATATGAASCSERYADVTGDAKNTTKYISFSCKATTTGVVTFTISGDITGDDKVTETVYISKTTDINPPREKETNSTLSSLSVDGYDIGFDSSKKNYSIEVEPSVQSITINARAKGSYASITGAGTFEMDGADKVYTITCRAENGTTTDYTINVSIVDPNPITVVIKDITYKVVKSSKMLVAPTNTTETTIKINDIEVPAFTNETTKLTIVGIKAEDGTISYAVYSQGEYSLYNENKSKSLLLYIVEKDLKDYEKTNITINEKEYFAYKLDNRFYLVYAMNLETGEYAYYRYDTKDNNFQYYSLEDNRVVVKENKKDNHIIIIIALGIALGALLIAFIITNCIPKNNDNSTEETKPKKRPKKRKKKKEKTVDDI